MMKHRIRAAVMILQDDKILLVEQGHPLTDDIWWTPPGGGREAQDADIFACAKREVKEECGLDVTLDRIIYLREYYDLPLDTLMLEIYFLAKSYQGNIRAEMYEYPHAAHPTTTRVGWFDQASIQSMIAFPGILKNTFWEDKNAGFPGVRYLANPVVE